MMTTGKIAPLFAGMLAVSAATTLYAGSGPSPEDVTKAKQLANTYRIDEGNGVVALKSSTVFSFRKQSGLSSPVGVTSETSVELMCVKEFQRFRDAIFYDSKSEVGKIRVLEGKNHIVYVYPEKTKYEQDGIFYSDAMLTTYGFDLGAVGNRYTVTYDKTYYDPKYLTSFYFEEGYPVELQEVIFEVPYWMDVEIKEFNFAGYEIEKSQEEVAKTATKKYIYRAKKLQGLKRESNAPNFAKSHPHLLILSKSWTDDQGRRKNLLSGPEDLYGWYASLVKDISQDNSILKSTVDRLIQGKKTDVEKVESIFYWVQENIRYIAFENGIMGFKPESCNNVYNNKYGDCKGKANLLKEMLKLAGFDARLTWIGTADIPYDYTIPSLSVDNHMICTLLLDGKRYFLDGTEEYISFNDYAHRIQGRPVMIEDGEKYLLDQVPSYDASHNKVAKRISMQLSGELLKGSYEASYDGEEKTGMLRSYAAIPNDNKEEAIQKFLTRDNKNLKVSGAKLSDFNIRQQPVTVRYDFELSNAVSGAGNELYINLDQDKELIHFDFDSTRVNDYEFDNKIYIDTRVELQVPAGYQVDYLPDPVEVKNDSYHFSLACKQEGNKVVYSKLIVIENPIISNKSFTDWNNSVKKLRNFYKEQIVLKK